MILLFKLQILSDPDRIPLTYVSVTFTDYRSAFSPTVDVVPYHEEYDAKKDVPIVSAATAWTHPDTGETFILDYHQALWYGKEVANSLLNPNQMRFYGHRVSDDITDKNR